MKKPASPDEVLAAYREKKSKTSPDALRAEAVAFVNKITAPLKADEVDKSTFVLEYLEAWLHQEEPFKDFRVELLYGEGNIFGGEILASAVMGNYLEAASYNIQISVFENEVQVRYWPVPEGGNLR